MGFRSKTRASGQSVTDPHRDGRGIVAEVKRGAPGEILADNDAVFRGRQVAALAGR